MPPKHKCWGLLPEEKMNEGSDIRDEMKAVFDELKIIGDSEPMQRVKDKVTRLTEKKTDVPVLITGETGVGKDLIAKAIHKGSTKGSTREGPFKAVNCGAFAPSLLQSELFGHEKGAFTDATNLRRGAFEQANKGTLFLDEVAEMPPEVQVHFLRVLETQEFTRLGGETNIKVNVRIIAATNVNLVTSVREKKFRQDLYYRLNIFRIHIPPLRDRREDIPALVKHFIETLNAEHRLCACVTEAAADFLESAEWYGNVRELRNAIESAMISADTKELKITYFPFPEFDPDAALYWLICADPQLDAKRRSKCWATFRALLSGEVKLGDLQTTAAVRGKKYAPYSDISKVTKAFDQQYLGDDVSLTPHKILEWFQRYATSPYLNQQMDNAERTYNTEEVSYTG